MMMAELSILIPAFIAGVLVLATHVPLGIDVLKRGIIFIDLAIAQMAGLGALAAMLLLGEHAHDDAWIVQLSSLAAALSGALLLTWTEKAFPEIQEALIGCMFVFAASLALLIVGQNPHGGEHMKDILAGQILWVTWPPLIVVGMIYAAILVIWFRWRHRLNRFGFYGLFAVAVTASVQLVGVYLVFASLILPAVASRNREGGKRLIVAYAVGTAGLLSGLLLSSWYDLPTGPTIVCSLFGLTIATLIYRARNGAGTL